MIIASDAARCTQATLNSNDEEYSILVQPFWGSVEYNTDYNGGIGSEWNSGEIVEVVITDGDMNFDARVGNQMTIGDNKSIIPALKIGSPITAASIDSVAVIQDSSVTLLASALNDNVCSSDYSNANAKAYNQCYEKYSERMMLNNDAGAITFESGDALKFVFDGKTLNDFKNYYTGANGSAAYQYLSLIHI